MLPPNSQNPSLEAQEFSRYQKSLPSQPNVQNPRFVNPNIQRDPYYYPNQGREGAFPPGMPYINPNIPNNQNYPKQINPNTGLPYDRQGSSFQPQYSDNFQDNQSGNLRNKNGRNRRPNSLMDDRYYNDPNAINSKDNTHLYKFRDRFRASYSISNSRSKSRSNSKNRIKSPADIPFSTPTKGKCFACNVDCNISKSGNSPNNFVPYMASFGKKRNNKTYYDEDMYDYYQNSSQL